MVLTPAEKRRYRERLAERAKREKLKASPAASLISGSFSEFMGYRTFELDQNLDAFGIKIVGNFLDEEVQRFDGQKEWDPPLTALQRAEALVDVFIDAARDLAQVVNAFKLEEISAAIGKAIDRNANLPRSDVDALKQAIDEIDRLKLIKAQLEKPTRHTVLAIRADGEADPIKILPVTPRVQSSRDRV
ncbi:hypothetical protein [Mesorhizobium sp. J428]|uniref:hypothetical protein n=1 Tax=Mesorhizobium sp. J428 TaxID=2898440 RepID=UPI0021519010|nr:hypothetical protein [Mesorhizobium sp. J428]MCR5857965.1 hypothetical protein [Mesorhizobium sp. J428]